MATESDLTAGTITLTNGSDEFTGVGTSWLLAGGRGGDTIIDLPGTPYQGVVKEIVSNTAGKLTKTWEGPDLTVAYRYRLQPDGSRVAAQARNLIELLGNGNLQAMAGLAGSASTFAMFTGPGAMVLVPKTDLVSGAAYDVQVANLAARAAYDGMPGPTDGSPGFAVLVSNVGDGRSAIYSKASDTSADWTAPAYVTGGIGLTPDVTVGDVTTGLPGTDVEITPTPTPEGVELNFVIPAGEGFTFVPGGYDDEYAYGKGYVIRDGGSSWITLQATTGNAPPTLPTISNAYWELFVQKGQDGAGTGDVVGPDGATDGRLAAADGPTGKLIKYLTAAQATASLNVIVGDSGLGGTKGLVPAPSAGDAAAKKVLKADGSWGTPIDLASQLEAEAGTDNAKAMTALRTRQSIAAINLWEKIGFGSLAGLASSQFLNLAAFCRLRVSIQGLPVTSGIPALRLSRDNGANWDAGATDYQNVFMLTVNGAAPSAVLAAQTYAYVSLQAWNSAYGGDASIEIGRFNKVALSFFKSLMAEIGTGVNNNGGIVTGYHNKVAANNGLIVYAPSGGWTSGEIMLEGIRG